MRAPVLALCFASLASMAVGQAPPDTSRSRRMSVSQIVANGTTTLGRGASRRAYVQRHPRKPAAARHPSMDPDTRLIILAVSVLALIHLTPSIWVLASGRSHGGAKFGWFLLALLFTWLGLAVFLISTQASRDRNSGA